MDRQRSNHKSLRSLCGVLNNNLSLFRSCCAWLTRPLHGPGHALRTFIQEVLHNYSQLPMPPEDYRFTHPHKTVAQACRTPKLVDMRHLILSDAVNSVTGGAVRPVREKYVHDAGKTPARTPISTIIISISKSTKSMI